MTEVDRFLRELDGAIEENKMLRHHCNHPRDRGSV